MISPKSCLSSGSGSRLYLPKNMRLAARDLSAVTRRPCWARLRRSTSANLAHTSGPTWRCRVPSSPTTCRTPSTLAPGPRPALGAWPRPSAASSCRRTCSALAASALASLSGEVHAGGRPGSVPALPGT
eukprot:3340863-Amphidinium_carterae.1